MATDKRVRSAQEGFVALLLVVAVGAGTYSLQPGLPSDVYTVEVGWWNIRDFSLTSRDASEITQIAECLDDVDVLAVGELNDPAALQALAQELGNSWEWAATDEKVGNTPHTKEYYGFIWDSDVVSMVGEVKVDEDPGNKFDREPAFATFRTVDNGLDFTVACIHATWGDGKTDPPREARLLDKVWSRILARMNDDDDLILVGDFNVNIGDSAFDNLLAIDGVLRANQDTKATVVKGDSTYDQVFINVDDTREWTGEWFTNRFDIARFNDNDQLARLHVSDHRPIWITLYWSDVDDD